MKKLLGTILGMAMIFPCVSAKFAEYRQEGKAVAVIAAKAEDISEEKPSGISWNAILFPRGRKEIRNPERPICA